MAIDVAAVRRDTPSVERLLHFNNAGVSLTPQPVFETVVNYLKLETEIGGYEAEHARTEDLARTYDSVARLLNADRSEIALCESATRAWDMAFYSFPLAEGDRILTSAAEYASNVVALLQMRDQRGVIVDVVPDDAFGQIDLAALDGRLNASGQPPKLMCLTHVPTQGGLVNPAAEVGKLCHAAGVPLLLDACQSVGQMNIDVKELQCDMLSATGRKFLRGPRGTGFLWVNKESLSSMRPPLLDVRAAEWTGPDTYEMVNDSRRFESFEANHANRLGLGRAVEYALEVGLADIEHRVTTLATLLRESLSGLRGVEVRDRGQRLCGITTFTIEGRNADEARALLQAQSINTSVSRVQYARMDFPRRGLNEIIRASVHYYNTADEIEKFCLAVDALAIR